MMSIAASGVRAYQGALTTVSENIANVATPGYSRRASNVSEVVAPGVGSGLGVHVNGVSRAADPYRAADVRRAGADLARTTTGVQWLSRIESALGDAQLGQRLTSFFGAVTTLAADPSAIAPRAAMLESAKGVAQAFTATGSRTDGLIEELDATAIDAARQLSSLADGLARINDNLARVDPGSDAAANLADQRDRALEQMSAIADVNVTIDSFGRAAVRVGGNTGPFLVNGTQPGSVSYARDQNGGVVFTLTSNSQASTFGATGGALGGIADVASRLTDTRQLLGVIATDFVTQVNTVQGQGRDLDGVPGTALFSQAAGDPLQVGVATDDPRKIAAAAVGGGTRDNGNLALLTALRTSGNYEGRATDLAADNASALSARRTVAEAQEAIHASAVTARDAASGVNLDSEAVDLMRFQQAYQASSRVIQIARETLQSILDIR